MRGRRGSIAAAVAVILLLVLAFVAQPGGASPTGPGGPDVSQSPPESPDGGEAMIQNPAPVDPPVVTPPLGGSDAPSGADNPNADATRGDGPVDSSPTTPPGGTTGEAPASPPSQKPDEAKAEEENPKAPQEIIDGKFSVTLSISCSTVLDNMDKLNKNKAELIPTDGLILKAAPVTANEGESVFNVLAREARRNKIHMESASFALYNSSYIEGIANLYEFDCGELSGWMYRVNGEFPPFGASKYTLSPGDRVEILYTCDLGADIGGAGSAAAQLSKEGEQKDG